MASYKLDTKFRQSWRVIKEEGGSIKMQLVKQWFESPHTDIKEDDPATAKAAGIIGGDLAARKIPLELHP